MKKHYIGLSIIAAIIMTGCGNSDSNINTGTDSSIEYTGYYIDSPVEGITYETESGVIGETDKNGAFKYKKNEKVNFKIGKLDLGSTEGKRIVTPEDMEGISEEQKELTLRFLQSIDKDNDLSNGIQIPKDIKDSLQKLIEEKSIIEITNEKELLTLTNEIADKADKDYDGYFDKKKEEALSHFKESKEEFKEKTPEEIGHFGDQNKEGELENKYSELSDKMKEDLLFMWNEKKLAEDIYSSLGEKWENEVLKRIGLNSESVHKEKIEELLKKYNIGLENEYNKDTMGSFTEGEYSVEELISVYNKLIDLGKVSEVQALKIGCLVEKQDIEDLEKAIKAAKTTNAEDIIKVYENLKEGSKNHYSAFDKELKSKGYDYGCEEAENQNPKEESTEFEEQKNQSPKEESTEFEEQKNQNPKEESTEFELPGRK